MAMAAKGIEELIREEQSTDKKTQVTYIAMDYHAGDRVMLTQAISVNFENAPAKVELNNLAFDAHDMFLAHYSPMWIELNGDARATYVIPGRIEAGDGERINVMPSRIYVAPVGSKPLGAVLTSERKDAVMDVLHGRRYMLETRSPQLVVINGSQYVNIDEVPMILEGTAVITPRNLVRAHTTPISLDLMTNAGISYK